MQMDTPMLVRVKARGRQMVCPKTGLSLGLVLGRLPARPQSLLSPPPPAALALQACTWLHPGFYKGAGNSNPGLHTYTSGTLKNDLFLFYKHGCLLAYVCTPHAGRGLQMVWAIMRALGITSQSSGRVVIDLNHQAIFPVKK